MGTTTTHTGTAVDRFLACVTSGAGIAEDVFAEDAVFDATVPQWRYSLHGSQPIREQLGRWFDHPGTLEELERLPTDDGEVVRFQVTWTIAGELQAAHQAHVLHVRGDRIVSDTAWCGGRFTAERLAEIAAGA